MFWVRHFFVAWLVILAPAAGAYETDQLSRRGESLADSTAQANEVMNRLLQKAVWSVNQRPECGRGLADLPKTRKVLAKAIWAQAGRPAEVPGRLGASAMGYDGYTALLEKDEAIPKQTFARDEGIYGDVPVSVSPVLALAGICSTVYIAGVRLGTDKLSHFVATGWDYFERAHGRSRPDRAVRWGVRSERGIYGFTTSSVFSFGDLRANWEGYQFYVGLLEEGSIFELREDGCVEQVRPFDWAEWVDWQYDEVYNPPVMRPMTQKSVRARLQRDRDAICAQWSVWRPDDPNLPERLQYALEVDQPYYNRRAPARTDPFEIDKLCAEAEGPLPEPQGTELR